MKEEVIGESTLYLGDCLESLRKMPDNSVDSIVTDPPYGLSFMGKKWDYDVPSVEVWAECLRVLKPGGHLLAFAGTRTQHRMAVRIEDAGFEIRDMIAWVYSTGFPKSMDVSKAIDKAAGAERTEVIGKSARHGGGIVGNGSSYEISPEVPMLYAPATDAARQWQGWGTALKPALEPITMARKPLTSASINVLQMVESQLRERGVRGEILWKPEPASVATKKKRQINSSSTEAQKVVGTSAESAAASETQSAGQKTETSSAPGMLNGANQTVTMSASTTSKSETSCGTKCSQPTAGNATAAEKLSATFSLSTTSTAVEPSTENPCMARSTTSSSETDSRLDTECFAGIATGLTGSMGTVHISRDSEGFFLWPKGLPEFVPGSPLTVAENVLTHGTGAINVDGCRVPTGDALGGGMVSKGRPKVSDGWDRPWMHDAEVTERKKAEAAAKVARAEALGRWPANLIHDGSEEVLAGFPQAKGAVSNGRKGKAGIFEDGIGAAEQRPGYADDGSAARFFYCAKASKRDRDEGCEGLEVRLRKTNGDTGPSDNAKPNGQRPVESRNHHPTVKPTDLMAYLCRLVTPPGGVVLDPFMGSGSTGKAAMREGFRFIGCELSPEYMTIARARIEEAYKQPRLIMDEQPIPDQGSIFEGTA